MKTVYEKEAKVWIGDTLEVANIWINEDGTRLYAYPEGHGKEYEVRHFEDKDRVYEAILETEIDV